MGRFVKGDVVRLVKVDIREDIYEGKDKDALGYEFDVIGRGPEEGTTRLDLTETHGCEGWYPDDWLELVTHNGGDVIAILQRILVEVEILKKLIDKE